MVPAHIEDPLSTPFRVVRRIEAGSDAPFRGTLARVGESETAFLVDVEDLPETWSGWRAPPDGHVLCPLDLVRRHDGHQARLPMLAGTLKAELDDVGRQPLTDGEAVTLAVSLLRGAAEVRELTADARGEWWMTEDGRPVLATEVGSSDAVDATVAMVELVAHGRGGGRLWDDICAALRHPLLPRAELQRLEDALFAWAPAESVILRRGRSARRISLGDVGSRRDDEEIARSDAEATRRPLWEHWARYVDADLADLVGRSTTALWRRARTRDARPRRGRIVAIAGSAAALVVLGGLFWPSGEPAPAASESGLATPAPAASAAGAPAPLSAATPTGQDHADEAVASVPEDLVGVTGALLDERNACAQSSECLADVMIAPEDDVLSGSADLDGAARSVVLLDDFGGAAVLRVDDPAGSEPSQLVVIERRDDRWLVRSIRAANQP